MSFYQTIAKAKKHAKEQLNHPIYSQHNMKEIKLLVLLLLSVTCAISQDYKVLFLGNSYTNFNDLPNLTRQFAESMGDTMTVDSNTPGGYTFNGHSTNNASLTLIEEGDWDFVVLQEQSQIPSFPLGQVETECFPFAEALNNEILEANPCAETVFYMTWGREAGDNQNCTNWPPVCTYEGMDDLLAERYETMAEDNEALVSPVGSVWRYIRENHPNIGLYSGDGSHPSPTGSYAAAVTHYVTMFREDPTSSSFNWNIDATDAATIREAVKTVVFDDLIAWNIGAYDPAPSISFDQTGDLSFEFIGDEGFANYTWTIQGLTYQDDVNTQAFTFPSAGVYPIVLEVTDACGNAGTVSIDFDTNPSNIEELYKELTFGPNPTSGTLQYIFTKPVIAVILIDALGRSLSLEFTDNEVLLPDDVKGLALIQFITEQQKIATQIIIE